VNYFYSIILCSILFFGTNQKIRAQSSVLNLKILDNNSGETVPARVEIRDTSGIYYIAENALLVGGDCDMSDDGSGLIDLESTLRIFSKKIENPYTNSTQFYSDGESAIRLPAGKFSIKIFKGPEYLVFIDSIDIELNKTKLFIAKLSRWINMPEKNWYSSDDHLHIPRPVKELDPYISKMMQAEDIHVANLLQMGKYANANISPQYIHGPDSHYQVGNYILAAGQENPRSHFLGHTITLGAQKMIYNPEKYLIYRLIWEEAVQEGGINGYAHTWAPDHSIVSAHNGLAIILPHDLMHFMEVLQFNRSDYALWYDILNLGFKVAPTAGTDYPCVAQNIPGHERFYTKVAGSFNYKNWLTGVDEGRTFVTTGPMVEFSINNEDIGSNINLRQIDSVEIKGKVMFDPGRDNLRYIEIVQNGEIIQRISRLDKRGSVQFRVKRFVTSSSWFALRGYGSKIDESIMRSPFHFSLTDAQSVFHSAPIYVTIPNAQNVKKREVAQTLLAILNDIENMLSEDNIQYLAEKLSVPNFDAVPKDVLLSNRHELLEEIRISKKYFNDLLNQ